jgi:hemerythrin
MMEFNYPESLDHSQEHKLFMDKTPSFLMDFEQSRPDFAGT